MLEKEINLFLDLIEKEMFYQAHEVLEEFWYPRRFQKDTVVLLIKGFINAAVSFELYKKKRYKQSKRVWQTYLKYKKNYEVFFGEKEVYLLSCIKKLDLFNKNYRKIV